MVVSARVADRPADLARQSGHRAAMAEWIALLDKLNQSFEVAIQAMAIDGRAQPLHALERCVDERGDNAPFIAEPRFDRLLQKFGLLNPPTAAPQ